MPNDSAPNSAEVKDTAQPSEADRAHNLSMELNRKLENLEKGLESKINALLSKVAPAPKAADTAEEDLDSLLYSDPKRYAQVVRQQAKEDAKREISSANAAQEQRGNVLGKLVSDFPELNDRQSPLAKAAAEEFATLPDHIKADPVAYEIAVSRAALKQGTKPISQRGNDDFTLSGNSGSKPRKAASKDESMDAVLAVAELFGKPITDPEYVKTLKGHARRNYSAYREPKPVKE